MLRRKKSKNEMFEHLTAIATTMGSKYNKHSNRSPFVLLSVLATLLLMSLMLTRTSEPGKRMSQRLHLQNTASASEAAVGGWPLQHAPGKSPLSTDTHKVFESNVNMIDSRCRSNKAAQVQTWCTLPSSTVQQLA
jgi:hypothetical protein